jgi:hypothetical protein
MRLEMRRAERAWTKQERNLLAEVDRQADLHFRKSEELASAALMAAGFHDTKGRGWRRLRMIESQAHVTNAPKVETPVPYVESSGTSNESTAFDPERLTELISAARSGDRSVLPELRAMMRSNPSIGREHGDLGTRTQLYWMHHICGEDHYSRQCLVKEVRKLKLSLMKEGNGTTAERMLIDQVVICWLQINFGDTLEVLSPTVSPEVAECRMRRIERVSKRFAKSVELLSKLRATTPQVVNVQQMTVVESPPQMMRKPRRARKAFEPQNRMTKALENTHLDVSIDR